MHLVSEIPKQLFAAEVQSVTLLKDILNGNCSKNIKYSDMHSVKYNEKFYFIFLSYSTFYVNVFMSAHQLIWNIWIKVIWRKGDCGNDNLILLFVSYPKLAFVERKQEQNRFLFYLFSTDFQQISPTNLIYHILSKKIPVKMVMQKWSPKSKNDEQTKSLFQFYTIF